MIKILEKNDINDLEKFKFQPQIKKKKQKKKHKKNCIENDYFIE